MLGKKYRLEWPPFCYMNRGYTNYLGSVGPIQYIPHKRGQVGYAKTTLARFFDSPPLHGIVIYGYKASEIYQTRDYSESGGWDISECMDFYAILEDDQREVLAFVKDIEPDIKETSITFRRS